MTRPLDKFPKFLAHFGVSLLDRAQYVVDRKLSGIDHGFVKQKCGRPAVDIKPTVLELMYTLEEFAKRRIAFGNIEGLLQKNAVTKVVDGFQAILCLVISRVCLQIQSRLPQCVGHSVVDLKEDLRASP